MPTISQRTSIATGATATPLVGSQYEFAPYDATMEFAALCDKNLVTMALFAGPDILAEPGTFVSSQGTTDAPPKYPDDYHYIEKVAQGDRLKVQFSNGNAATTVVNWVLKLTPIAQ